MKCLCIMLMLLAILAVYKMPLAQVNPEEKGLDIEKSEENLNLPKLTKPPEAVKLAEPPVKPPEPPAEETYGLPQEVWRACQYEYQGTKYLDMTTEYWLGLGWQKQSEYATTYQKGYASAKGLSLEKTIDLPNLPSNVKQLKMKLIPPGRFWQGSPDNESGRYDWEGPRHKVLIPFAYYLSVYECTQEQYGVVMERDPSYFLWTGSNMPVEQVSWSEVANGSSSFCGKTGLLLPTESMWEYACRAGVTDARYEPNISDIAWYVENSNKRTHPVGEKHPNAYGLYDMLGNVWEWCIDNRRTYQTKEEQNPVGDTNERYSLIFRGGSWYSSAHFVRCASRYSSAAYYFYGDVGFRVFSPVF